MEPTKNINLAITNNPLKQETPPVVEKILSKLKNDLGQRYIYFRYRLFFQMTQHVTEPNLSII